MADINLTFGSEDLKKLLSDLNKMATDLKKNMGSIVSEDDAVKLKRITAEAKKYENELKRQEIAAENLSKKQDTLNQKKQVELGIIGKLKKEVKDYGLAADKATTVLEKDKALKNLEKTRKALAEAKGTTADWGKALGSFQFKFNALGNIAANVFSKMTSSIKSSINQFTSFEKIIRSNQLTSDRYDQIIARLKGNFDALNRAIAMGDFKDVADNMKNAADAAYEYVLAMDFIGDATNALNIQNARSKRELKELQETYNDTSKSREERMKAALEGQKLINEMQERSDRIGKLSVEAQLKKASTEFQLTEKQSDLYKRFFENYGLLSDEQVTKLEALETATVKTTETSQSAWERFGETVAQTQTGVNDLSGELKANEQAVNEYNSIVGELTNTLGFDVEPIMRAIINTHNDQRTAIASTIISYEEEQAALQKLANSNATMLGSIIKLKEARIELNDAIEEAPIQGFDWTPQYDGSKAQEAKDKAIADNAEMTAIIDADFKKKQAASKSADEAEKKSKDEAEKKKQDAISATYDIASGFTNALATLTESNKQKELSAAGDNAKKREEIEKKYAKKQQNIAIAQALISAAEGGLSTYKKLGFPLALPFIAAGSVFAGIQIAAIKAQKFERGGMVGGRLHSQGGTPIEAEKGEYIINRRSTGKYKDLIEGINENDQLKILSALDKDKKLPMSKSDPFTKKMYEFLIAQETYGETNDYFIISKGNQKTMLRKRDE